MKYLLLFESHAKAQSLLNKYSNELTDDNIKFIDYIKKNVASGYVGKLTEFYIYMAIEVANIYTLESNMKYVMENIKDLKIKPIDTYDKRDFNVLVKDVKIAKLVQVINKIKKNNSIKYNADVNKIATYVYDNNIDLDKIAKLPVHNRIHSDEDFIDVLSGSLFDNLQYHKDWNVLYDTDDLLIYEILSYQGGKHLIHVHQCINSEITYDNYKKAGYKLYNLIDKNNIDNSLFIDGKDKNDYSVFTWADSNIGKITNGEFTRPGTTNNESIKKINIFIDTVINK